MSDKIIAMMQREATRAMLIIRYNFTEHLCGYLRQGSHWRPYFWGNIHRYNRWIRTHGVELRRLP